MDWLEIWYSCSWSPEDEAEIKDLRLVSLPQHLLNVNSLCSSIRNSSSSVMAKLRCRC